jgi:hypothetical protein
VLVEVEISHTVTIKALDSLGVGEGAKEWVEVPTASTASPKPSSVTSSPFSKPRKALAPESSHPGGAISGSPLNFDYRDLTIVGGESLHVADVSHILSSHH